MSIESLRSRKASDATVTMSAKEVATANDTAKHYRVDHEALRVAANTELGEPPIGKSKFSAKRQDIIVEALLNCNYRKVAASLAGITEMTLQSWLRRGKTEPKGEYHKFYQRVIKAEAEAESRIVVRVAAASEDDWKAGMELLRRRHPKRWNRDKLELTGKKGGPVTFKVVYDDKTEE